VSQHLTDDVLSLSMKSHSLSKDDFSIALSQIKARQTIRKKLPSWYENLQLEMPVQISTEQSSSEITANFKSSLFTEKKGVLVDLTGGMGVDCLALSQKFDHTFYVEQNEALCKVAKHNFDVLQRTDIEVCNTTAEDFLQRMSQVSCIFIDPARRDSDGKKVFLVSDCVPNVVQLIDQMLEKAENVLIKLSPMLDLTSVQKMLKCVGKIFVISVDNECKEVLVLASKSSESTSMVAVNITKNGTQQFSFLHDAEVTAKCTYADNVRKYLYEPNTSIMKVGAFKIVAQQFDLEKLHPNTHLYTSDKLVADFQGRIFQVNAVSSFSKSDVKKHLANLKKANLTVRNFPESVEKLRLQLKLKEGGDTYIFATTLNNENKVLVICEKVRFKIQNS